MSEQCEQADSWMGSQLWHGGVSAAALKYKQCCVRKADGHFFDGNFFVRFALEIDASESDHGSS